MFTFIANNLGSLLVLLAVAAIVTAIVIFRIRAKRQGKSTCGCGCASCPMSEKCHGEKPKGN